MAFREVHAYYAVCDFCASEEEVSVKGCVPDAWKDVADGDDERIACTACAHKIDEFFAALRRGAV